MSIPHKDLMLWQRVVETQPVGVAPGALLLCAANQYRVYLAISRPDGDRAWISTRKPTAAYQGFLIGVDNSIITNSGAAVALTGNIDPVTGDTVLAGTASPTQTVLPQGAPHFREWDVRTHGVLCQSEWWAWDILPGCLFLVQEVLQERDPSSPDPGSPYERSLRRGTWTPYRRAAVRGGRDEFNPPVRPEPAPRGLAAVTRLPEAILNLLRLRRRPRCRPNRLSG